MKKLTKEEKKLLREKRRTQSKSIISEFKRFVLRGNVVDMAVGVIVATAFTKIITALTDKVIMPLLNWIIYLIWGNKDFTTIKTILRKEVLDGEDVVTSEIAIEWGTFISAIINFVLIALVIFVIVKILNYLKDKFMVLQDKVHKEIVKIENKKTGVIEEKEVVVEEEVKKEPTTNELLQEIIGLLKDKEGK